MTPEPVRAQPGAPPGPARVGDELRARREALGWDLGEIATALRIRLPYLEALERGDLRAVPGNAYAMGFLRNYANILGLDPEPICRRFRNESRDVNRKPELAFPAPVPERGVPAGAAVLVGLVVIGAVYAGWYHFSSHTSIPAQSVPPLPAPVAADDTPPGPARQPSPAVASVLPDGASARPPSVLPAPPAETPAPQPPATVAAAPAVPSAAPAPVPAASPAPTLAPTSLAPPAPAVPEVAPDEVALVARATTWVQVRRDGHVLYDHTMNSGDRWVLPAGEGQALMTVGNAGGLVIVTGGAEGQPLGRDGAVLRNVKLGGEATAAPPAVSTQPVASPQPAASPAAAPVPAPAAGTDGVATLSGDFSGSGAARPKPRRPKPATVPHETSADELNNRQLQQHQAPASPPADAP